MDDIIYSYEEIRPRIQTGDVLLFSSDGLISNVIKYATKSIYTHVGMAITSGDLDTVLLFESTTMSKAKDIAAHKVLKGVQLVFLSERIKKSKGRIWHRELKVERTPEMIRALKDFRREVQGRPYEKSQMELLKSAIDGPLFENEEDLSSIFCSELLAEAWQRMVVLDEAVPSNEYVPADFAEGVDVPLINGAALGPQREIKTGELW